MVFKRTLLALGAALIAGGLWMAAPQRAAAANTGATPATQDLPAIPDMSIGNPDAKVHVIEYLSFTCPHCEEFHATVWPKIKQNYIDNGKIRFTIREVYFDKYGLWAGMMAQCGGAMRYFGIVDMLYNQQREWAGTSDPNQAVANLRKIGLAAGISSADLDKCMTDGKMAQAMVAKFQKDTAADHIEGTPSFVIDGTTHQNMGYQEFAKILDAELAKSK